MKESMNLQIYEFANGDENFAKTKPKKQENAPTKRFKGTQRTTQEKNEIN